MKLPRLCFAGIPLPALYVRFFSIQLAEPSITMQLSNNIFLGEIIKKENSHDRN